MSFLNKQHEHTFSDNIFSRNNCGILVDKWNREKHEEMKQKRVDCKNCANFEPPVFDKAEDNCFVSKIVKKEKCKRGKRVMFRIVGSKYQPKEVGWFRYCEDFKEKTDETNNN